MLGHKLEDGQVIGQLLPLNERSLLKGQFIPNQKYVIFLFVVMLFIHLDSFGVSGRGLEIGESEVR